jgi:hypothetical protein
MSNILIFFYLKLIKLFNKIFKIVLLQIILRQTKIYILLIIWNKNEKNLKKKNTFLLIIIYIVFFFFWFN